MKFIILTQYYPPEVGAPQARLSELAVRFVQQGHSVTVLTAMPNYPSGKIHAGYGGLVKHEERDGVNVIRTFIYPTQKADILRRLTNYFSFVLSSMLFGTFLLRRSDYLLVESPPLFLGLSGVWLSWAKRAKLIFNVSDLWPESAVSLGILKRASIAFRVSSWLESFFYKRAWLITGQSKSILENITGRFPSRPTYHLSNGVDATRFGPEKRTASTRETLARNGECVALYAGLHGLAQGLDQILLAASQTRSDPDIRYVLVGDGPEKRVLVEKARREHLDNVRFLDSRPSSEMPSLVASCDVVMVTLKKYIPGAVPSKLYESMASGRPVILVAEGEAADIVNNHNAGIVIKPNDIIGLTNALRTLSQNSSLRKELGANGRKAAESFFDRNKIAGKFIEHLEAHV